MSISVLSRKSKHCSRFTTSVVTFPQINYKHPNVYNFTLEWVNYWDRDIIINIPIYATCFTSTSLVAWRFGAVQVLQVLPKSMKFIWHIFFFLYRLQMWSLYSKCSVLDRWHFEEVCNGEVQLAVEIHQWVIILSLIFMNLIPGTSFRSKKSSVHNSFFFFFYVFLSLSPPSFFYSYKIL